MVSKLRAIVLSGGRLNGGLRDRFGVSVKSQIPYRGRTLLRIALEAVVQVDRVEKPVAVVGPQDIQAEVSAFSGDAVWLLEGAGIMDNIERGAEFLGWENNFLLLSPDLPLLTAGDLDTFLRAIPVDAEIAVPIIPRESFLDMFPNAKNRFAKTSDGYVTMGSAFYIVGAVIKKNLGLGRDAYRVRKNILKLGLLLGFPLLLGFVLGRVRISDVERRVGAIADANARGIVLPLPRLAYDIDNEENLRYLEELSVKEDGQSPD